MRIIESSVDVCSSDLTLLSRASYRCTPGWAFRWPTLKRNLSINGSLTATQLVFIFTTRLQELVIGSVIGVVAVGIYRTAWRTVDMNSNGEIGRASGRERGCQNVENTVSAES